MRRLFLALGSVLLPLGCSSERAPDEPIVLVGDVTNTEGYTLATGEIVDVLRDVGRTHVDGADFYLSVAMEISFKGTGADPLIFCDAGEGYADASEITTDPIGCQWSNARIIGNATGIACYAANKGFLVKGAGDAIHRMRIVDCSVDEQGLAQVSFQLLPPS